MKFYRYGFVVLCLLVLGLTPVYRAMAQTAPVVDHLHALAAKAKAGVEAAEKDDQKAMLAGPEEIEKVWSTFEDDVRKQNPTGYVEIEAALDNINEALKATPLDPVVVGQAYDHLMDEANDLATKFANGASTTPSTVATTGATVAQVLNLLDQSYAALQQGNRGEATEKLNEAVQMWPSIEGSIATKSQDAYTKIEGDLGRATAALRAQSADAQTAQNLLLQLRQTLAPFAETQSYGAFDAAAIILREGLEALLVVVALLAFLRRSNNSDKSGWIWGGAGVGVLVSIGSAFVLQAVFNRVSSGQNRELIEGITGLVAALLLFYVSYWLHSKASLHAWQHYINTRTSEVLARGSMFSLALLAFLAVFREGAETTIFYLGMAPSIAMRDLWLGLGLGFGLLAVAAYFILVVGVRLPLRLFFRVAGLLVYYLGFKFVGAGIHSLQVSGVLHSSPIAFLHEVPFFGFYPTWETLIPQIVLLASAVLVVVYLRNLDRQTRVTSTVTV